MIVAIDLGLQWRLTNKSMIRRFRIKLMRNDLRFNFDYKFSKIQLI